MVNLAQARRYVELNGSLQERARLSWLMEQSPPPQAVINEMATLQKSSGGFAYARSPEAPGTVDATLTALWQLDEIGLLDSSMASWALDYLSRIQQSDGGWDEDPLPAPFSYPPWIEPGSAATRSYLTSYAAYWLGLVSPLEAPSFQRALAYLIARQEANGKLPGYLHATWLSAAAFTLAGPAAVDAAGRALVYLESRLGVDWQASQLAWALDCLLRAGVSPAEPFYARALRMLCERQLPDGSFASEDGDAFAVSATIQALKVFSAQNPACVGRLDGG